MASQRQSLNAQILRDKRGSPRRTICLTADVGSISDQSRARINDLSETGLKITSATAFEKGETVVVELPLVGTVEARIVWTAGNSCGAEFLIPVSKATISAALLRSQHLSPASGNETAISEVVIGTNPSLEEIAAWAYDFQREKGANGYKLLGFRKTDDGTITAWCSKEIGDPH